MKKIEKKMELMIKDQLLSCPKCREPLSLHGKSLKCVNLHTYDLSKKGTVNFVLGYGEDNYNLAMLEARERVIQNGFFNPILEYGSLGDVCKLGCSFESQPAFLS